MAEEASEQLQAEETEQKDKSPPKPRSWRRFLTKKWLGILLFVTILVHGIGFSYARLGAGPSEGDLSPEVDLGTYRFVANQTEKGRITGAEFCLHIALLEQLEPAARQRLKDHRHRVQQGVEELLRHAHGGDFDDPALGELKRRLQERINETLGMRAIDDVIITQLKLTRNPAGYEQVAKTADSVPWKEDTSK